MTTIAAILKHKGYQVTTVDPTATIAQVADVLAAFASAPHWWSIARISSSASSASAISCAA